MPERRRGQEFRQQQSDSAYPFVDGATLLADSGQQLPRDTFLDASLYPIDASGFLYLSEVEVLPDSVTIRISDSRKRVVASTTFDPVTAGEVLPVVDLFERPAGVLVSSPLLAARFAAWPSGSHLFPPEASQFVSRCVIAVPGSGVRGLTIPGGDTYTGDVLLLGDYGVVLRVVENDPPTIRVDMVGDPLFRRRLCGPTDRFETPSFVRSINGCTPDAAGNFQITVGTHEHGRTILRTYTRDGSLVVGAVGRTVLGDR